MGLATTVPAFTNPALPYDFANPQDVSGLTAWYSLLDTLGYTTTSSSLETLVDRSGNAFTLTANPSYPLTVAAATQSGRYGFHGNIATTTAAYIAGGAGSPAVRDRAQAFSAALVFETPANYGIYGQDGPVLGGIGPIDDGNNGGGGGFAIAGGHDGTSPYDYWLTIYFTSTSNNGHKIAVKTPKLTYGKVISLILTYDGSGVAAGVTVYINGTAVSLTTVTDTLGTDSIVSGSSVPYFGSAQSLTQEVFLGEDAAFYNRALTTGDVATLYGFHQTIWDAGN